jgi:hypothetical protein
MAKAVAPRVSVTVPDNGAGQGGRFQGDDQGEGDAAVPRRWSKVDNKRMNKRIALA